MRQKKLKTRICIVLTLCLLWTVSSESLTAHAASVTKTVTGITYKVTNAKKKTAAVSKSSKSIKKATIKDTIKIKKKQHKITKVYKNAFKKRIKLKNAVIGKNVKTISTNAFYGSKNLKTIKIMSKSLTKIQKNAFKGIHRKAVFFVPADKYNKYCKLIKRSKVGWKKTMKVKKIAAPKKVAPEDVKNYSYAVTPITDNVCYYFYVKTDNPDPESFVLMDQNNSLSNSGKSFLEVCKAEFADVNYTDKKTWRVNGGYIFTGDATDGGNLKVMGVEDKDDEKFLDSKITISLPILKSSVQYLIDAYTTTSMSFFEKMDAIQTGLDSICLYDGVWVLGNLNIDTENPYYGLSTSPHVDQDFYIQDPYYRTDSKPMLTSALYPYILDSLGFPGIMGAAAEKMEPSVSCKWNDSYHWLIDVTFNGETRRYGGAGNGGGQGIEENMIKYKYSFDGSAADAYAKRTWAEIRSMIDEYGTMTVAETGKTLPELTWQNVTDTVGEDGSYVRLLLLNSIFFGGGPGYTFIYKDGDSTYPGYFSDAWYDGRYFNSHEFFEKGTTLADAHASKSDIIFKDPVIPIPEAPEGTEYVYNYQRIDEVTNYDADTGAWNGFVRYNYDSASGTWISEIYNNTRYWDNDEWTYVNIDDADFKKACTLTSEDVATMQIDHNANTDPTSYYIYDMTAPPGTKVP